MEHLNFTNAIPNLSKILPLIKHTFRYNKLFLAQSYLVFCQQEVFRCLHVLKKHEQLMFIKR